VKPRISIIAALGANRVIGKNDELLWHIPEDLKRFKTLTLGHPVIMGRKTYDSIVKMLGKPLPGRTNIVVTRQQIIPESAAIFVSSMEEALEKAKALDDEAVFIIGGAQIYAQALPFADRLYLTLIDQSAAGDAYFPAYEREFTKKIFEEAHASPRFNYRFVDLER